MKKNEGNFIDTEMIFEKNDTILIKYSVAEPSLSEVSDKVKDLQRHRKDSLEKIGTLRGTYKSVDGAIKDLSNKLKTRDDED